MAIDELGRIRDRLSQDSTARRNSFGNEIPKPVCIPSRLGCTFFADDRVFDRVSGLDGIVLDATRENTIVPTPPRAASPETAQTFQLPIAANVDRFDVRLSDGQVVRRTGDELVKRPKPPAVK